MLLGGGYSGKRSAKQKYKRIFIVNSLRKKPFKIRLGLERLSSRFRIKLFQGQTVDLKFPYLVLSAAGTWSLGFDAAREHATHNQSILPLITAKR